MRRSGSSASLLVLALLLLAAPVFAADGFGERYHRAEQLYEQGRYADSIAELRTAFAIKPLPRLLLNIGQLHLKLGQAEEALAAYDAFQRLAPRRSLEAEETLRQGMAEARALAARQAAGAAEEARKAEPPQQAAIRAAGPARSTVTRPLAAPRPEATPLVRRWWLWTAVGLVAAGVTTGVALGLAHRGPGPLPGDVEVLDVSFRGASLGQTGAAALAVSW